MSSEGAGQKATHLNNTHKKNNVSRTNGMSCEEIFGVK